MSRRLQRAYRSRRRVVGESRRDFLLRSGAVLLAAAGPRLGSTADSVLRRRQIPGTDETLGVIGLGNSKAFGQPEVSRQLLSILAERGGSLVDTRGEARFDVLTHALVPRDVFLCVYIDGLDLVADRAVLRKLREMRNGQPVDLVNISNVGDLDTRWSNLRDLKGEGLARYIGIASLRPAAREAMLDLMPTGTLDFVQVNYSALEREVEKRLLPMALEHDIAVVTSRPFMNGRYFPLVKDKQLPDWASEFDCESWAQFSLKFVVAHPAITCVLTETTKPKHARDNMGGGVGRLPDEVTRERMAELLVSYL